MGLVIVGNYVWYLAIVVKFMGFEGAKKWGNTLKSPFGMVMQATMGQILWGKGILTM